MYSKYSNKYQQSLGGGGSYYSLYNSQEPPSRQQGGTQYTQLPGSRYNCTDDYIRGLDRLETQLKRNNTLGRDRNPTLPDEHSFFQRPE